ncbi:hypothetical protein [Sphingomonas alpina]|uniref:Uncharacterized protein n=1 Tax=Sphingomonas alpina TaxID=653931 RepID=A0A7H0LNU8_9SPHN|nr:hypothetical protein [Sphingomonas alpina]QNQ11351.1 hypothetical protein H3Z74_09525 [Sphingomonas alpina]
MVLIFIDMRAGYQAAVNMAITTWPFLPGNEPKLGFSFLPPSSPRKRESRSLSTVAKKRDPRLRGDDGIEKVDRPNPAGP